MNYLIWGEGQTLVVCLVRYLDEIGIFTLVGFYIVKFMYSPNLISKIFRFYIVFIFFLLTGKQLEEVIIIINSFFFV